MPVNFNRPTAALTSINDGGNNRPILCRWAGDSVPYTPGDDGEPTLVSAVVGPSGTSMTVTFSEAVLGHAGLSMSAPSGESLTYVSGDGTAAKLFTVSLPIPSGWPLKLNYDLGDIADAAGNAVAPFAQQTVTNGSVI